jgi:hypothetical protein
VGSPRVKKKRKKVDVLNLGIPSWVLDLFLVPYLEDFMDNSKPRDGGSKEGWKWAPTKYHFTNNFIVFQFCRA